MTKIVVAALLLATSVAMIPLGFAVSDWERANGYPYGKMCNSVFTLYVDTCR